MLIRKHNWETHVNWNVCTVLEYPEFSKNFGIATAKITGRYPEKWFCVNHECEQLYISQKWNIKIFSGEKFEELDVWDAYYFKKNEKYYVESNWCEVLIINSPVWTPEQSEYLD